MKWIIFSIMVFSITRSFVIEEQLTHPPETHYGDPGVACNPGSGGTTGGFSTFFNDTTYSCPGWSGSKAYGSSECFVAINGICGMDNNKFCDHCIHVINSNGQIEKCRVIDFCDPKNCGYYDAGHLDFLTNNGNAGYKFTDKGVNVFPYKPTDGVPKISWKWTSC